MKIHPLLTVMGVASLLVSAGAMTEEAPKSAAPKEYTGKFRKIKLSRNVVDQSPKLASKAVILRISRDTLTASIEQTAGTKETARSQTKPETGKTLAKSDSNSR